MRPRPQLLLAALLALWAPACNSTGKQAKVPKSYEPEEVDAAIEQAQTELTQEGMAGAAMKRMSVASQSPGLDSSQRVAVQRTLEAAADAFIDEFEAPGSDPRPLVKLLDEQLPRRIEVRAGMRAAHLWFEKGQRMKAYRLIQRIDREYPQHFERHAAGALLFDIGDSLANDKRRYGLFFKYRNVAPEVLEYLVLNHPSDPRGDQALWILASIYEQKGKWEFAIEKQQDLILWFNTSPLLPAAKAQIPHLRLASLASPEYDRAQLQLARAELEAWLGEYPAHELVPGVEADLLDCLRRLADNDMVVARFYRRVKNFDGAEYHARRALEEAHQGEDAEQIRDAQKLLDEIVQWGGQVSQ